MKKIEAEADTTHNTGLRMSSHDFSIFPGANSVSIILFNLMRIISQDVPVSFTLFCLVFLFNLSTASIMVSSAFELLKDFVAVKAASSEDFNQKIATTKWTKTYEAMTTTATCFRDNCNGK